MSHRFISPPLLQVDCATMASVSNLPGTTATVVVSGPPQLAMLPTKASSSPTWLEATATSFVSGNSTLYLLYNTPSPLSLLPCASLAVANASVAASCAAVAFDTLSGADLCGLIDVHDVSTIDGQAKCTASSLTLGTCLPGQYTLQYTATNPAGQSASSFLLVLVEMRVSIGYSYEFTPDDRCVTLRGPVSFCQLSMLSLVHFYLIEMCSPPPPTLIMPCMPCAAGTRLP